MQVACRYFSFPSYVSFFLSFFLVNWGEARRAGGDAAGRQRTVRGRGGRRNGRDCIHVVIQQGHVRSMNRHHRVFDFKRVGEATMSHLRAGLTNIVMIQ